MQHSGMRMIYYYLVLAYGLEMLVKTSESFSSEYGVTFNAKKTECVCFGKNACPLKRQVNVNGQRIKWKDKVTVLGTLGMNRVILRHKFGVPRENGVFNYQ